MISVHWTGLLKSYIILVAVAGQHEHEHEHERQTANSLKYAAIKNSIKLSYIWCVCAIMSILNFLTVNVMK